MVAEHLVHRTPHRGVERARQRGNQPAVRGEQWTHCRNLKIFAQDVDRITAVEIEADRIQEVVPKHFELDCRGISPLGPQATDHFPIRAYAPVSSVQILSQASDMCFKELGIWHAFVHERGQRFGIVEERQARLKGLIVRGLKALKLADERLPSGGARDNDARAAGRQRITKVSGDVTSQTRGVITVELDQMLAISRAGLSTHVPYLNSHWEPRQTTSSASRWEGFHGVSGWWATLGYDIPMRTTWKPHEKHGRLTRQSDLPASVYAFPKERKEPLTDARHVRNAAARFDQVTDVSDAERALAFANIKRAAAHYGVALSETSWKELGVHPQGRRKQTARKGAATRKRTRTKAK